MCSPQTNRVRRRFVCRLEVGLLTTAVVVIGTLHLAPSAAFSFHATSTKIRNTRCQRIFQNNRYPQGGEAVSTPPLTRLSSEWGPAGEPPLDAAPSQGIATHQKTIQLDENDTANGNNGDDDPDSLSEIPSLLFESDPNDHRYSASDWLQNMRSIPRSTILREIKGPVSVVMLWSAAVSCVYKACLAASSHRWASSVAQHMCITSTPHSFLVSALGLLLVFRTNSAYQRFAEGRIIWERILSISRNMSRMSILYEKEIGVQRRRRMFRLLAAFPYLLHHHIQPRCFNDDEVDWSRSPHGLALKCREPPARRVRSAAHELARQVLHSSSTAAKQQQDGGTSNSQQHQVTSRTAIATHSSSNGILSSSSNKKSNLHDDDCCWVDRRQLPWSLLPPTVLAICARTPGNRPLWICDRLSQEVNEVVYTPNFTSRERLTLLGHIDKLSQCIGQCERIHQTAVPLNYARHSLRSLTLWLFTLPFALIRDFGWLTGPVMGLAAWLLYGIYQIGFTIEDPFQGSLQLRVLCDAIFRDVMMGTDMLQPQHLSAQQQNRMTAFSSTERERMEWEEQDFRVGAAASASLPGP